jgi:deazaflavin-dependent oxidoreductase (nitroreductase family)
VADDRNAAIIAEFRANAGKVGGYFEGTTLLLLHHTGARTGQVRVNPVGYQQLDGGDVAIFASKGGADTNPDWLHNVIANPHVRAEIGTEIHDFVAHVAEGEERDRIWTKQKIDRPQFAEYERKTAREIPVIVLHRVD